MDESSAEAALIFFIIVYWVFFGVAILRLLFALCDILCKGQKWTYTKVYSFISIILLNHSIQFYTMHFNYLFSIFYFILFKFPAFVILSPYSLLFSIIQANQYILSNKFFFQTINATIASALIGTIMKKL